jgi:hypothetical protein
LQAWRVSHAAGASPRNPANCDGHLCCRKMDASIRWHDGGAKKVTDTFS